MVNVALPAIRADLDAGLSEQQWVVEAYLLTLSSLILLGGSLGDLLGRRRIFAAGVAGFGAASLLCAAAMTPELLILARGVQGVAGALLVPSTLALLMDTFDEDERAAAIGSWTAWTGVAAVVGPLLGGVLIDVASWRWIFAINVAPALATLALLRYAPAGVSLERTPVDWVGGALCGLGLAGPVFALIEQPAHGWSHPLVAVPLAAGLVLLATFVAWEARSRAPMMPLRLFASRNFSIGNITTLTLYAGLSAATFFLVLFLQQVSGYSALEAGLALMPVTLLMLLLSKRIGRLADRWGPRLFMGLGSVIAGVGLLLMMRAGVRGDYASDLLPGVIVFGLGLAASVAPLTATVLGAVEPGHSGVASGVNNAVARVAGLLAIAALGALVASQFAARVDAELAGRPLSPAARAAVEQAKGLTFVTRAPGVPASEREPVARALGDASLAAFRLGMGISGALVVAGGLVSLVGVVNPLRAVAASDCPAGAFCGAPKDTAHAESPADRARPRLRAPAGPEPSVPG